MPGDLPGVYIGDEGNIILKITYIDVFHCYFGIGGLALMGYCDLVDLDPAYALGVDTLAKYNIPTPWSKYKRPAK